MTRIPCLSEIRAAGRASEKAELVDALERCRGNLAQVARSLGRTRCKRINRCTDCDRSCERDVSRAGVYRMMDRYGIVRPRRGAT